MLGQPRAEGIGFWRLAAAAIIAVGILAVLVAIVLTATDGTKRGLAVGIAIAVLPVVLYAAIRQPFVFPFGVFVMIIPFDSILRLPHFGTITKLVALCCGLAFIFALVRQRRFVKPSRALMVWIALLMWAGLSVFWALDPVEGSSRFATYAQLILLFVVISLTPISRFEYRFVLGAVALSGLTAAAYSVYLYHSGIDLQQAALGGASTSRLVIYVGEDKIDPNAFSATMLLPVALVLTWALSRAQLLPKMVLIGAFVLLVGGMYANGSRGALVALATMIGYMMLRGRFRGQLVALSVIALGASFLMPHSPWARFSNAVSTGGAGRVSIWEVGYQAFKQRWLVGAGTGNFPIAFDRSFISVYQSYYSHWHRAPHNNLLEFAVELGIIGLLLLVGAWYAQFNSLRLIDRKNELFDTRIALEAAVIALFVASMFISTLSSKFSWLLFEVMAVTRSIALLQGSPGVRPPLRLQLWERDWDAKEPMHKEQLNA